jgi:polyphosphate kinase
MPRNSYERVAVIFPVKDIGLRERLFDEILRTYLRDTDKARILNADGSYARANAGTESKPRHTSIRCSSQTFFMDLAQGRSGAKPVAIAAGERVAG